MALDDKTLKYIEHYKAIKEKKRKQKWLTNPTK